MRGERGPPRSPYRQYQVPYLLALLAHRSEETEADDELTFASADISAGADIDCSGCGLVAVSAGALGDASAGALVVASAGGLLAASGAGVAAASAGRVAVTSDVGLTVASAGISAAYDADATTSRKPPAQLKRNCFCCMAPSFC